jgi:Flp pilus assembly pilin Flp
LNKDSRQRGQALAEHGLLIALIVVLVISSLGFFGASASGLFDRINSSINGGSPSSQPTSGATSNPTGGPGGSLIISDPAPAVGQTVTLTGSGFKPQSPVQAVLHSETIVLKTQNADTSGNVTMEVRIPPTIDLGHHLITLEGQNAASTPITVSSQPLTIGANPISASAQVNSGPLYSGNYTTAAYTFSATAAGGVGNLTETWTGADGFRASGLAPAYSFACTALPGSVTFSAIDGLRHQAEVTIALAACPTPMNTQASITAGPTYGDNYRTVTYTFASSATGGQNPLTAGWRGPGSWTSTESAPTQTFACTALPGDVTYTSTDAHGQLETVTLALPACTTALSLDLSTGTQTYSGNYAKTTIALNGTVAGGVAPYTYAWTGPGGFTSATLSPTMTDVLCSALPASAQLTVTDAAQKTTQASVNLPGCTPPLVAQASITTGPLYDGNYSSATYVFAGSGSGGAGNLTYSWTGPEGWTSDLQNPSYTFNPCSDLAAGGVATLTVSDGAKTTNASVNLSPCPGNLNPQLTAPSMVINGTNVTYTLGSAPTGGSQTYPTYAWTTNLSGVTWSPTDPTSSAAPTLTVPCANITGASTVSLQVTDSAGQTSSLQSQSLPTCLVLTITVNAASKTYGAVNPSFSLAYAGFIDGDYAGDLTGTLNYTTSAITTSAAGVYSVSASGRTSTKYEIVYVAGNLTISQVNLTIKANDQSKAQGVTLNLGTTAFTSTGLVLGQTVSGVTLTSSGAASSAPAGGYDIVPSDALGLDLSNYNVTYTNGALQVTAPAAPTFVNSSITTNLNTLYIDLTMPTGVLPGDLLIIVSATDYGAVNLGTPSGWTKNCPTATCSLSWSSFGFYSKIATSADVAGTTYRITGGASTAHTGVLAVYRNAVLKNTYIGSGNAASDSSWPLSGVGNNSLIVVTGARLSSSTACTISSSPAMSNRGQECVANLPISYLFDYLMPTGGSLSATFTPSPAHSTYYRNVTYVLSNP